MRSNTILSAAVLAFTSIAFAQDVQQSAPFQLILLSDCTTYNGSALYACHEGAAIEGLCTGNVSSPVEEYNTFGFNYTTYVGQTVDPKVGQIGTLTWVLEASTLNVSSAMSLVYNPASNVAIPIFEPSYTDQQVAFDETNQMNIPSYVDDTVTPPTAYEDGPVALKRWYVCQNYYEGYSYVKSLSWIVGVGGPQNPSCEKVEVVRVFV